MASTLGTLGPNSPLYAEGLVTAGAIIMAESRIQEGARMVHTGMCVLEATKGPEHKDTVWARSFLTIAGRVDEIDDGTGV